MGVVMQKKILLCWENRPQKSTGMICPCVNQWNLSSKTTVGYHVKRHLNAQDINAIRFSPVRGCSGSIEPFAAITSTGAPHLELCLRFCEGL